MIVHAVSGSLHGYYVCPMRRLHRCDRPSIKRDLVDYNIINELLFNCSKIQPVENKKDAKEGANKQVISSQADSLIKISRIWADFFPQTHRISLFRLFFHHFWRYFRFLLRSLPTDVSFGPPETGWRGE